MSALTVTLGADISSLRGAMAAATRLVGDSAKRMANISLIGIKAGLGAALAGGASALAGGIKAVTSAANFEQTQVAFATLIGDAAKAEQTLAQLRELGAKTPFEFPELADAGRKLIAFGEGADTVAATLSRIGDVSAGVQAPINEIAELYGKARVQGRLFAEDINQLTGRGIPIIGELARQFGVSDSQVKKLIESGQVGFPAIEQAFIDMTSQGGKFAGMMETQSKTTNGLFSTLKDSIGEVFLTLGTPINDAIRPLVEQAISLVQKLAPIAAEAGIRVRDAMQWVIALFKSGQISGLVSQSLQLAFATSVNFLWAALRGAISATGQLLIEVFRSAVTILQILTTADFWTGMGNAILGIFLGAVAFLQKGLAEAIEIARPLAELFGQEARIDSAQGTLRESAKIIDDEAARRFGRSGDQLAPLAGKLADRMNEAGQLITERFRNAFLETPEVIGTDDLRERFSSLVNDIRKSIPKPKEREIKPGLVVDKQENAPMLPSPQRLAPIVTSLGRVGGGGFGSSTSLDAQRETNRLTRETNRLLTDLNRRVDKLRGGGQAAFG